MVLYKKDYPIDMKLLWRCHVCNDIHYGAGAPVICPSCGAKRAYVLTDNNESLKIIGDRGGELSSTKSIINSWKTLGEFSEDFQLVDDVELVNGLAEGVLTNQKNHGLRFCPCRLTQSNFIEDLKLICPCNFFVQKTFNEQGECWCGLFVKREAKK